MYSRAALNFSQALVSLAKERAILDPVQMAAQELATALKVPELTKFLSHPSVPVQGKRDILKRLVPPGSPPEFDNFINLIIDRRREGILTSILEAVIDRVLEAKGYEIVELISAFSLADSERDLIRKNLEGSWRIKVALKYRQNPNLIGGIIIRRGDQLIDGSLSGQLNALKQLLIGDVTIHALCD
jgi:F-type H+-transporting ATPase subunit delta